MASSQHHQDNERERFPLPWEDDDTTGLSIHPLTQADMEAILAQMPDEPDAERPIRLASRRRAPSAPRRRRRQAYGTPGASAQAEYQRRRTVEHAAWARTLSLRVAAVALAGLGSLLVAAVAGLSLPAGVAAAASVWWRLRFQPSPETLAWQRGADLNATSPACWSRWCGPAGASATTCACPAPRPTSTAMMRGAAVAVRSDPNIDRPRRLQSGSVDRCRGRRRAPTSRANVTS